MADRYAELRAALEQKCSAILIDDPDTIRALLAERDALREALEECVKLLARTPKVTRDIYVGRDSIAWGRQAGTVCKHARAALSQEQGEKHDNQD